ncbi:MAG: hypothetical protein ACYSOJ_05900 [Planctomycetota bacterium]
MSQLIIINMIVLVGCESKSETISRNDNAPKDFYDLTNDVTCEDIIQSKFPKTASNFHGNVDFFDGLWIGTVVASLPENDLPEFTNKLSLVLTPDILDFWPEAFESKNNESWDISKDINSNAYYFEYPNELTRVSLKYEKSKIYFKRETKYSATIAKDGTILFEKIKK